MSQDPNAFRPGSPAPVPPDGYDEMQQVDFQQARVSEFSADSSSQTENVASDDSSLSGVNRGPSCTGGSYADGAFGPFGGGDASNGGGYRSTGGEMSSHRSHAWIVGIVVVIALCVVTMFGMWSCSNVLSGGSVYSGSEADLLTSDTIAIINIDGTIQYDGTTNSPEGLKEQLDIAADNECIKAVVLRVNSGGGVATAGEEMTEYVRDFMESTGKPVVVSSAASNASAAYEISSQADYIYVGKTTAIGAIGTAMKFMDYSGLMELLGISTDYITSSENKDSTYGTRGLTEEEREYYQAQVDQINETFIDNVAQGRDMSVEDVRDLATGLTFTGVDAVENGLADEIGTQDDAISKAIYLAGCSYDCSTIVLDTSSSEDLSALLDLMSQSNTTISANDLAKALKELESDGSIEQ